MSPHYFQGTFLPIIINYEITPPSKKKVYPTTCVATNPGVITNPRVVTNPGVIINLHDVTNPVVVTNPYIFYTLFVSYFTRFLF